MQLNFLVLSYVASAAVSTGVVVVAWRRRSVVGARGVALLMLAVAWWLLANAFEAAALDRSAKIAWSVIAYPGIESVAVLYLLFVVGWTRQDGWVTRARVALLFVVPTISVGMAATNEWHHLLWTSVTLTDAWGVTAVYDHGPWFWVEVAYAYTLVGAGLIALVGAMYRYPAVYSSRMRLVVLASVAPIVGSVVYAAGLQASLHADLSSIAFAVAGLVGAWAILRSGLLDLTPVAWTTLVDTLADAVLVLDPARRIAAFNRSATGLLGMRQEAVGQAVDHALDRFPELVAVCQGAYDREVEIQVGPGQPGPSGCGPSASPPLADRWFNVRLTAIGDRRGRDAGCTVVLRDVTERRRAVEEVRLLSLTDELTGLLNRRGFATLAKQQMRTSMRTRNRLWLLFADVDGLKEINDRLGHEAGDRALHEIAQLLRTTSFREADLVGRLGGDEFAVLATEISQIDGETLAERVRGAVEKSNQVPGREYSLSMSVGVSLFDPERPRTLDVLIHEADHRMYGAKHSRRGDGGRVEAVEVGPPTGDPPGDCVLREVDEGIAELLVAGEAEGDREVLPRLPGGRCGPGEAGERLGRREALADVTDLRQQGRCPHLARPRQAAEDGPVGMELELLGDPGLELGHLVTDGEQGPDERARDRCPRLGLGTGHPERCGLESPAQLLGARPPAVPLAPEPGGHAPGAQPCRLCRRGEPEQEAEGDRGVELEEQPDRPRVYELEVCPELLHQPDPGLDQVLASADGRPERDGLGAVGTERPEPLPVGPQDVGEQVCVGPVVLVARGPVPGAERLHVAAGDDDDLEPGAEQGVDDRAVRALDRDPADACHCQPTTERPQARPAVLDLEPLGCGAVLVDDADGVGAARPVDARVSGGRIDPVPPRCCRSLGAPS